MAREAKKPKLPGSLGFCSGGGLSKERPCLGAGSLSWEDCAELSDVLCVTQGSLTSCWCGRGDPASPGIVAWTSITRVLLVCRVSVAGSTGDQWIWDVPGWVLLFLSPIISLLQVGCDRVPRSYGNLHKVTGPRMYGVLTRSFVKS